MRDPSEEVPRPDPSQAPTEASWARSEVPQGLLPGLALGRRYRLIECLGRGGMGEVWRAHDQKLRLDVALKALRSDLVATEPAREQLREEVRSARQVVSPSVCRIYDLVEVADLELVSMEYIEGRTLIDLLREKSPFELSDVAELARQFLSGLEAIHAVGLVHRDIKPENIMISRAGRVVIMDFGVARSEHDSRHTISGTPAYMAPEHARGDPLDARADIYAAGVVLCEMVHPAGVQEFESRRAVWEAVHQDPPVIPESPWRPILSKAVSAQPQDRYPDARALLRAIEKLHLQSIEESEVNPYPGLSPFSSANARFFFGREIEVEGVWRRIAQAYLLALVGPSGAGKSSFIRAGLLPAMEEGWRAVHLSPGDRPFKSLAEALLPEFEGDAEGLRLLRDLADPDTAVRLFTRWRRKHDEVLLILDQFEELFTLNSIEVQAAFTELIGCIALEADVRVLLSLRDDFLLRCHEHPDLSPIFADLTPLQAPGGLALRRALEQPALQCGYRFEDEALVVEMLQEVEGERGALPLLAFAVASLWERRDRERQLLTRRSYEEIGGVGGALARHAEATMDRIGADRTPIVRELFRNLVTAENTRAARDRDELLSIFDDAEEAAEVLRQLVDARLLTSFEHEDGQRARIEIVHESLLRAWPRLVRWQTQDTEGAFLREQLRQAAKIWEDRGRPSDLLWTGTAYTEFLLWQERYVGGLTAMEKDFAHAMTTHAERARRRRRMLVSGAFVTLLVILAVVGNFWRSAVQQARIAKANELVGLGSDWMESFPSLALTFAMASLEFRDSEAARRLAIEAAWKGPTRYLLPRQGGPWALAFSPDGKWMASGHLDGELMIWPSDGGAPTLHEGHSFILQTVRFHPERPWLLTLAHDQEPAVRLWSYPEGEEIKVLPLEDRSSAFWSPASNSLLTLTNSGEDAARWREWPLDSWESKELDAPGAFQNTLNPQFVDPTGTRLVYCTENRLSISERALASGHDRELFACEFPGNFIHATWSSDGGRLAALSENGGELFLYDLPDQGSIQYRRLGEHPASWVGEFDAAGNRFVTGDDVGYVRLWDLLAPPGAQGPMIRVGYSQINDACFSPDGNWLFVSCGEAVRALPLAHPYPLQLQVDEGPILALAVDPQGRWISTIASGGEIRIWPLSPDVVAPTAVGNFPDCQDFEVDGRGQMLVICGVGGVDRLDLQTGEQMKIEDCRGAEVRFATAIGPDRRLVASAGDYDPDADRICISDLGTGESRYLERMRDDEDVLAMTFLPDGRLLSGSTERLMIWNPDGEEGATISEGRAHDIHVDRAGHRVLAMGNDGCTMHDLENGASWELPFHAGHYSGVLSPDGDWVATCSERTGEIRISPADGGSGHLYLRHEGGVNDLVFDPLGRWLISAGADGSLMFWPMPEGEPLHDLPHKEFLRRFKALTNERVVSGEEPGSYDVEEESFPGWDTPISW